MPLQGEVRKCLRCGKEYTNPNPPITNPAGNTEIATDEWCADCNKLAMAVVFRESSAYWTKGPFRSGVNYD